MNIDMKNITGAEKNARTARVAMHEMPMLIHSLLRMKSARGATISNKLETDASNAIAANFLRI